MNEVNNLIKSEPISVSDYLELLEKKGNILKAHDEEVK
jgi:hypothetical protein